MASGDMKFTAQSNPQKQAVILEFWRRIIRPEAVAAFKAEYDVR
jgi:hypothetical protein